MKLVAICAAALACLPVAALAQAAPASAPAAAAVAPTLDTPIEALVANPKSKAVLDADIPGLSTHEHYEMFKAMSLRAIQPMSNGKITEDMLKKVEADLAAIK
ncbi:hypothetical protein RZN05_17900 [Sphingomonas sp. HF-S4]|uniref:Uncharacterized protein n=1 Tax=Sphingomonas agrestis TaxID=3080540 RepID=A0ABU3YBX3_9SPHN|nr:hypothetical protein [Sphingomonas sp. HF-S4]MDV3458876.1 hypothetical protein [Sphingomonas sp. HF-S4]